jgi:hypothetical protein
MTLQYKLPSTPHFAASGLREMEERDVEQVTDLYKRYMDRFDMAPLMTAEEVKHNFLSGKGTGEIDASGRREGQVLWVYVVEVIPMPFYRIRNVYRVMIRFVGPRDEEDHRFLLVLHPPIFGYRQRQAFRIGCCVSLLLCH